MHIFFLSQETDQKSGHMTASARHHDTKEGRLLLITIALAAFMAALDATIVNIALPTISTAFDVSTTLVSWVATAYLLVVTGCLLIFGILAGIRGLKKIFLPVFAIFSAGSFFCGFLPVIFDSFYVLIGSRVFQAVSLAGFLLLTGLNPIPRSSSSALRSPSWGLRSAFSWHRTTTAS